MTYANAGQTPPCLLRVGGDLKRLDPTGLFLGSFEDATCRAETIVIEPGDMLVCYSDGVIEATNRAGKIFGEKRLIGIASRARHASPLEVVNGIMEAVDSHCGRSPQDDLTLLVLKREA